MSSITFNDVTITPPTTPGWEFELVTTPPNDVIPIAVAQAFDGTSLNDQVDVAIVPSGGPASVIGAFSLQVPDGTAAGGNKRGQGSIDLQTARNSAAAVTSAVNSQALGSDNEVDAAQTTAIGVSNNIGAGASIGTVLVGIKNVATGGEGAVCIGNQNTVSDDSAVAIGGNNTASVEGSVCLGESNTASANDAVAAGFGNTASGVGATAFGHRNTADGTYSRAAGVMSVTRGVTGADVFGAQSPGPPAFQRGHYCLIGATTDATPAVLTADGQAASATNQVALPNNSAFVFHGKVVALDTGNGNVTAWEFNGAIKQGANAAATAMVAVAVTNPWGATGIQIIAQDVGMAGVAIALSADTTNGALSVTATGLVGENIDWFCDVMTGEVT